MGIYTDLAAEAREMNPDMTGIEEEESQEGEVLIKRIRITSEEAASRLGKKQGMYITLDAPELETRSPELFASVAGLIGKEINRLLDWDMSSATVLVVGLGNSGITPDSLGPEVVNRIHITRHIKKYMPEAFDSPTASVCAIAPGVLGITGVETMDVVKGVVDAVHPDAVIAVDALASRRASRISCTVQLSDTGISPGSGVGNTRSELSHDSLGVPVIAIGVPLVVYASTITWEVLNIISEEEKLDLTEDRMKTINETLISRQSGDMIVTPKDIDTIVSDMSGVVADGINLALFGEQMHEIGSLLA